MKDTRDWSRLDNAAKIFPPNSSKRDTKVFRFTCELVEDVDEAVLQHALEKTAQQFPLYCSILKQGLFWYYFEQSKLVPKVKQETGSPCAPLYDTDRHGLLYRVTYYKMRINLEVFHALADGTGALQFLRTMVRFYLSEKYGQKIDGTQPLSDYTASRDQKHLDAFYKYYEKDQKIPSNKKQRAYHIWGTRLPNNQLGIIEGVLSAKSVLEKSRKLDATLTEFLVALFICSIYDCMAVRDRAYPVAISVPVNLRRYFPSQTARNFFGVVQVSHNFKNNGETFEEVLKNVRASLRQQLDPENLMGIINRYSAFENKLYIKAIPLQIKILFLKFAGWWAQRKETSSFSNIGRITMPEPFTPYIRLFDMMVSSKRPQVCMCSFGDKLVVSFSSPFVNTDVQQSFFRRLAQMGMEIEIVSNLEECLEEEDKHASL